MFGKHLGQDTIKYLRTFEITYVNYGRNPPSSFWELLRTQRNLDISKQAIVGPTVPKVGQSTVTTKGSRPPDVYWKWHK